MRQIAYQTVNLTRNNIIYEEDISRKLPKDTESTWRTIQSSVGVEEDDSIVPYMEQLISNQHTGAGGECAVADLLLRAAVFCFPGNPLLVMPQPYFRRELVPISDHNYPLSTPKPDLVYAYKIASAFSTTQRDVITRSPQLMIDIASTATFPFLIVEYKGNDPMWHASNQCLGDTATSINLTEQLNEMLEGKQSVQIQTTIFSIAVNACEAVLHVSWKEGGQYVMKDVDFFHLRRQEELLRLKKYVRSIIEWAKKERLNEIRKALDLLV